MASILKHAVMAGIKAWLRLHAPITVQMVMTPELAEKLADEIVAELKAD